MFLQLKAQNNLRQGAFFTPEQGKLESQKQQELYGSKKEWQKQVATPGRQKK